MARNLLRAYGATITSAFTEDGNFETYKFDTSGGAVAFTLLPANRRRRVKIIQTGSGSNPVTVTAAGSDTINGGSVIHCIGKDVALVIEADGGTAWHTNAPHRFLYTNTAASSAVTNTTTETLFDKSFSIPANALKAGSRIRIRYQGIATATNSTDTLAVKLYLGGLSGTALISHAATDVANNDVFAGEYELIVRTAGASGTVVGAGTYKSVPAAEGTATYKDDILASTTIDTTAAQAVGVSATWSVANAGNSCRLDVLSVEVVP